MLNVFHCLKLIKTRCIRDISRHFFRIRDGLQSVLNEAARSIAGLRRSEHITDALVFFDNKIFAAISLWVWKKSTVLQTITEDSSVWELTDPGTSWLFGCLRFRNTPNIWSLMDRWVINQSINQSISQCAFNPTMHAYRKL